MASTPKRMTATAKPITLAIDIGGSGIKGILLSPTGQPIGERLRIVTPQPSTPKAVFAGITELVKGMGTFESDSTRASENRTESRSIMAWDSSRGRTGPPVEEASSRGE